MTSILKKLLICLVLLIFTLIINAQESSLYSKAIAIPNNFFGLLNKKATKVESRIDRQTEKYLLKLEKNENRLRKELLTKDSSLAHKLFDGVQSKYFELQSLSGKVDI